MTISANDPQAKRRLVDLLARGGVAIIPCDTVYGIVGRVPDTEARIRTIKGREETNPFLMLIGGVEQLKLISDTQLDAGVQRLWPGPVTLVIPAREGTVAVRLPDDAFLRDVILSLGAPIYSTSVNRSGSPPLAAIEQIVASFETDVDLILDGGSFGGRKPSTILDVSRRPYRILREGSGRIPPELLT